MVAFDLFPLQDLRTAW